MLTRAWTLMAIGSLFALASVARADQTIGDPDTAAAGITTSGGHQFFGQTFTVPAGETGISSATLRVRRSATGVTNGAIEIYNYDETANNFVGAALYSSPITAALGENQTFTVTPHLSVVADQKMALIMNWGIAEPGDVGSYYRSSYYDGGHFILSSSGVPFTPSASDLAFELQFAAVPEPASALLFMPAIAFPLLARRRRMDC